MRNIVIVPSKHNLLRDARPLSQMQMRTDVHTIIIDAGIREYFAGAVAQGQAVVLRQFKVEHADNGNFVVLGLDKDGDHIATWRGEDWPVEHRSRA
jgi:hypothetical protein